MKSIAMMGFAALSLTAVSQPQIDVDDQLPAGCLKQAVVEGDAVHLTRDYRDTEGGWFYWKFRVAGAAGKTLTFDFPGVGWAVGSRGAAVSCDRGKTWRWSSEVEHESKNSFAWTFAEGADEVWFAQTIPYLPDDWAAFLSAHAADRGKLFETAELCKSKKGRSVPYARFGLLDGSAKIKMFVSARHHCQEASASPVVEGMAASFFADDELGRWLRANVEMRVVPFADYDGVVDGDQGKNRRPHDHCRDYNEGRPQVHPEVAAIMKMLKAWRPTVVQDTHSPWLRDGGSPDDTNGFAYQVGNPSNRVQMAAFGAVLDRVQESGFGYRAADDVPFGKCWNAGANYKQGQTLNIWAQFDLKTCRYVTSFEIPFANQHEKTIYPSDQRGFGRDIMLAYREYLQQEPTAAESCLDRIASAVATLDGRLQYLTQTAEETVRRLVRNPYASIEVPRTNQWGFSEELWERAGGLCQIADGVYDTPDNVVLLSSRAGNVPVADGKLVIRFDKVSDDTRVNLIADVVSGWMWCCEYYAAASRLLGRVPPTEKGLSFEDSWVISCSAFSPDHLPRFVPCPEKIAAGKLGRSYLESALAMLARMREPTTCDAVRRAAQFVGVELSAGRTVGVAGLGHPIIEECVRGLKSNLKGIVAVGNIPQVYSEALKPGDTLVWFAYNGLNTYWADYGTAIRKAGLNLVLSHAGTEPCSREAYVKAFIPQLWTLPDASVSVPVRPFKIAPLSEVSRCTLLRMLDEEVAATHPRSAVPPPDYGTEFFATVDYAKKVAPPKEKRRVWTNKGFTFERNESFRWALRGKTGFDYDMLRPLSPKLIAYQKGLKWGLMSPDGRELTPPDKDLIAPFGLYGMPEREYAVFAEGGKYGKMDPLTGRPLPGPMTEKYPQ